MKTPCEIFVWYVLPGLRQELARNMINDHNLTQVQVAGKLGITEAAVSQYLSKKRGNLAMNEGSPRLKPGVSSRLSGKSYRGY